MAKKISTKKLFDALCGALSPVNPKSVKWSDKVATYVQPDQAAIDAFYQKLNNTQPFSTDGMNLHPAFVADDPFVYELLGAIIANYEKHGWVVTP